MGMIQKFTPIHAHHIYLNYLKSKGLSAVRFTKKMIAVLADLTEEADMIGGP